MIVASFLSKVRSRPFSRPRPPRTAEHEPDLSSCCRTSSSTGARARSSSCSRSSTATCVPPHPHPLARAPPRSLPSSRPLTDALSAPAARLEQRRVAVERVNGLRPAAVLPHLQPGVAEREGRPGRRVHPALGARAAQAQGQECVFPSLSPLQVSRCREAALTHVPPPPPLPLPLVRSLALPHAAIHDPAAKLSKKQILDMGYVMPIVDHAKARTTAIEKYKEAAARA